MLNRVVCSFLGAVFIAIGIATIVTLNYGMASFDTFVLTLSNIISMSYTNTLRLAQLSIFIVLVIFKKYFSLTWTELLISILSVVVVTVLIDIATFMLKDIVEKNFLWLFIGFIFYVYGITLLVQSDVFLAPNDKILTSISHRTGHTYALYKIITDVLMLAVSIIVIKKFNYDVSVSIISVFLTFFTGVFVGLFLKINNLVINKIK